MYDKDILKDDFMGEACLFPNAFSPNVPHTINLELQDGGDPYLLKKKRKGKSIGTIEVTFMYNHAEYKKVKLGIHLIYINIFC